MPKCNLSPIAWLIACTFSLAAWATPIRVVSYNVREDVNNVTGPSSDLYTILEAIGAENVDGITRPNGIDLLGLQETTSNTASVDPMVTALNNFYGAGTYARSPVQATEVDNDPTTGNGPNALIYNTKTLQLIASAPVPGTPSFNSALRQVMRYQLRPVGGTAANDFYIYVDHYKADSGSDNETLRNAEAQIVRTNADALGSGARIIYMGDFNLTGGSGENAYKTLTAAGNGQAFDPINMPGNWTDNSSFVGIDTESATSLSARFDFQLVSSAVMNNPNGLEYLPGSYHAFANNGSVKLDHSITGSTSLSGLSNRTTVLTDLTTASDHLPLVADYNVVIPEPDSIALLVLACGIFSCPLARYAGRGIG